MADLNTDDPSDVADGTGPGSSGNLATETFSPLSPAESLQSIRSNRISIQSNEKLAGSRADIAPEPSESSANAPDAGTPAAPSNPGLSAHHITIPTSNFTNKPNDSPPSTPSLARDANPPLNASHLRALALDNARLRTLLQKCETKLRDSEKKREGMEGELARTAEEAKRAAEDGKRLGKVRLQRR